MVIKRHIQFLLDKEKDRDDARIRLRIKYDSIIIAFNVGYRANISKWNLESQRVKANTSHGQKKVSAYEINKEIQRFEDACNSTFKVFEIKQQLPTKEQFKRVFEEQIGRSKNKIENKSLVEYIDEFITKESSKNNWTIATIKKFNTLRDHLDKHLKRLTLKDLSEDSLISFVDYLDKSGLRNSTIAKYISLVRWFLRWASNEGYYEGNIQNTFKPKFKGIDYNSKEVIHLTWDELISLYNLELSDSDKNLGRVRDVFCFCCFTSLRYSDVFNLKKTDVKEDHIAIVTQKTDHAINIDLNNYSKSILDKYKNDDIAGNKALPVISNQKMNKYLKELCKLAEFNEPIRIVYFKGAKRVEEVSPKHDLITTHCGRRTFIVNALYLGIPAEVVMRWTGHSDYSAMKPYIKIVDDLKKTEMNKFNLKSPALNKTGTK